MSTGSNNATSLPATTAKQPVVASSSLSATAGVNKALIPNANDLQSKLAKLQQNIAQKLNKANVIPNSTSSSTATNATPIPSNTPTVSSASNLPSTRATSSKLPSSSTSSIPKANITSTTTPSTIKSATTATTTPSSVIPPPQLSKIQKPHNTTTPINGLGKKVATSLQKSLKNTSTPITSIKPITSNTNKSINTINSNAVLNSTTEDEEDDSMEKQIYMKDYQRKKETSQIQQQYQQELLQHEQAQQELENSNKKKKKNLRTVFTASGKSEVWEDSRLDEFAENDYRIYANNLGNEITDQMLSNFFSHYKSFNKALVIRDKRTNRAKGYGFISFLDANDYIHALENFNGKYLGNRPLQLKPSKWKDRSVK